MSRVINGTRTVDPEIRARVQTAVATLGYEPNVAAQNLRSGKTRTIAFEVPDIAAGPLSTLVLASQAVLSRAGYALVVAASVADRDREFDFLMRNVAQRVDGIILTTSADNPALQQALGELSVPLVFFDRLPIGDNDAVLIAHGQGLSQALDYLFGLGHRRIGLVTGTVNSRPASERIRTYKDFLKRVGVKFDPQLIRARGFDSDDAFVETSALLSGANRPTAIVVGGTSILPAVVRAIRSKGLDIPKDISVIAGADSDLASLGNPAFSVIRSDYEEVGRAVANMLLDRIEGKAPAGSREVTFPSEFVVRQSCQPPPETKC